MQLYPRIGAAEGMVHSFAEEARAKSFWKWGGSSEVFERGVCGREFVGVMLVWLSVSVGVGRKWCSLFCTESAVTDMTLE